MPSQFPRSHNIDNVDNMKDDEKMNIAVIAATALSGAEVYSSRPLHAALTISILSLIHI